ncbi:hypothetical protein NDU88_007202, partial [Pleurodeles waltl]
ILRREKTVLMMSPLGKSCQKKVPSERQRNLAGQKSSALHDINHVTWIIALFPVTWIIALLSVTWIIALLPIRFT